MIRNSHLAASLVVLTLAASACSSSDTYLPVDDTGDAATPDSGVVILQTDSGKNPTKDGAAADVEITSDGSASDAAVDEGGSLDGSIFIDAMTLIDGSSIDATTSSDATVAIDASVSDDGSADGGFCAPADVSAFVPVAKPPNAAGQNVCSSPQVANFYTYCFGPNADTTQCSNFVAANGTCVQCMESSETDASYGPIVFLTNPVAVNFNYSGCIANANAADATCASALQQFDQCDNAACESSCTGTSYNAFNSCENTATANGCSAYYNTASTCVSAITTLDPAYGCLPTGDTETDFNTLGNYFCGP